MTLQIASKGVPVFVRCDQRQSSFMLDLDSSHPNALNVCACIVLCVAPSTALSADFRCSDEQLRRLVAQELKVSHTDLILQGLNPFLFFR
jgi:hypothetical protein